VRLVDTLGKDTWIFGVEEQVNSGQLNSFLAFVVPVSNKLLLLFVILVDEDVLPGSSPVLVLAQTFTWDGEELAIFLSSVLNPLLRHSTVILSVIESLKLKP
jgi:hypothetical protein